jgi:MFS family permease
MLGIMECRRDELERTLNVLNETGVSLVSAYNNGYVPAGGSDDKGMYYFIPWLAKLFGLSSAQATQVFYLILIALGVAVATFAFSLLFKSWYSRLISLFGFSFLAGFLTCWFGHSDIYLAGFFAVATVIPVFILLSHKPNGFNLTLAIALGFAGVIVGYCNQIRHHSGTGTLLFLFAWLLLSKTLQKKEKYICFSILVASFLIPYAHFYTLEKNRDTFLVSQNPSYEKAFSFPTWHVIYNGFGYLKDNKYGLEYSDSSTKLAALKVNPNVEYLSDEYYRIVKDLTFDLIKNDFWFVLQTVLAKIKNLLYKVLVYANIGLLLCLFIRPSRQIFIPCLLAVMLYSLPGVLVMPFYFYLSGMVATLVTFALYMINLSLEKLLKTRRVDSSEVRAM